MIDIMENEVLGPAIRQGISQGIAQGITQGITQGERNTLLRLLATKFGSVPQLTLDRLRDASEPDLLNWSERVLTATTLDEVFR